MWRPCQSGWFFLTVTWLIASHSPHCFAADEINFDRDIRPILSENCYHCHGPDAAGRQADLRLDVRDAAIKAVDGRHAILPGNAAASEIIKRIRSVDPDEVMPPPKSNRKLSDADKAKLEAWINAGAAYAEHWAFIPPERPAVPAVDGVIRTPIDAFILQRLKQEKLTPSPEADRIRLLRRVALDLTGLPPTPTDVDAFLADSSPDAYERAVDRLLASPRYGERMVWEWLDAARYADTNGFQGDPTRAMWYWRDWAVAALNANMPFDRFTMEQLAGDLQPQPTQDQLIATGFHRNHMINGEGGRIAEESRIDYVQDRVETTGTVWLGLTFNCCRCHDHKFDPISQKEYYQLAAFFNSIEESGANDAGGLANPIISLATPDQQQRLAALQKSEREANKARDAVEQEILAGQPEWEKAILASTGGEKPAEISWQPLLPNEMTVENGTKLRHLSEGVIAAEGDNPAKETFTVMYAAPTSAITGLKIEALPDPLLPGMGPGRAENGNFVLSEVIVEVYGRRIDVEPLRVDFAQGGFTAAATADGKNDTGWAVLPEFGKPHELTIALKETLSVPAERPLVVRLVFQSPHAQHTIGKFRISATSERHEVLRGLPDDIRATIAKPDAERTDDQKKALSKYFADTEPKVIAARDAANKAKSTREGFERSLPRTMVMRERAQPRDTHILYRGAYDKPLDKVEHGTPQALPVLLSEAPKTRLALAQWLVDPQHPLTARVVVNRIWQQFFGTGLVKTVEDFGSQGEPPSHPELLDWLAREFVDSGWDVKHMHRMIVTSAAYRQTSKVTAELVERDPANRLLARGPRYRWPSWMLRDQALAAAGLLVETIGGPPVKGYQPTGIWEEATFGQIRYQPDTGAALYRRSVYQFWRRIVGPTMFFDVSSRQYCTVNVARTNTPLQALATLNDTTYVEAARILAERVWHSAPDDTGRLHDLYRRCLGRLPTKPEQDRLLVRLVKLKTDYASDTSSARSLLKIGEKPADPVIAPSELAAWSAICAIVLNLDEMLSKE
ncbi:MAG TPA: PSD1 and planctomycete cytochrome C domain-containing protein [Planctomycetaceae bacterium]|nr:PSD1 and planctomycete cytochrome C domain-containing protein [Planctomycetaceae bacterium]